MDQSLTWFSIYRVGTELVIRLKWGQTEYKGTLESIDSYMNVLLRDTEEYIDGKHTGTLGLVLIRCVHCPREICYGH
jgi:small nuclear ribonucleoprotein F